MEYIKNQVRYLWSIPVRHSKASISILGIGIVYLIISAIVRAV